MAPLVDIQFDSKVEVMRHEDYIGKESVQKDADGKPVMSIVTTRDEGQDTAVYPSTATGGRE